MKAMFRVPCSVFRRPPGAFEVRSSKFKVRSSLHSAFRIPHSALAFALAATAGFAQEKPPQQLPEVVVTATRTPESRDSVAASVSVMTREEAEARGLNTLADLLDQFAGLAVVRSGTPGQTTTIFSRGTQGKHTLLTMDGRRQTPNILGGYDWASLTLDNVDRVEAMRSPISSLYGGEAIGGVINVITRSGRGLRAPEHSVSFEAGSFATFRESLASRGAKGAWDYSLSASRQDSDFDRANDNYKLTALRGSTGWEASPSLYLDLKGSFYKSNAGSPGSTTFPDAGAFLRREVATLSPGIEWSPSETIEARLYYGFEHQYQRSVFTLFGGSDDQQRNVSQLVEGQLTWLAREKWKLTFGAALQDLTFSQVNMAGVEDIHLNTTSFGLYAQSQWSPLERVTLANSVRHDHYSDYPGATTWRQALSVRVPTTETRVFGAVARAFSPPAQGDLFFPGFFGYSVTLQPESSLGWEAGIEQPLAEGRVKLGATWFRNEIANLINFDPTPRPGAPFGAPANVASALTEGIEASASVKPLDWLEARAGYTYLTALDLATGQRLVRRPRHSGTLDLAARPADKLSLTAGAQLVSARTDFFTDTFFNTTRAHGQDFVLLRAAAKYQLTKEAQLWLRAENLSDVKHEQAAQFPATRLGIFGGLKLRF